MNDNFQSIMESRVKGMKKDVMMDGRTNMRREKFRLSQEAYHPDI